MGYLPGLDGVRALAVIGVLLYHADLSWIPGGFLGVDVFFVLSGFLITSLILEEFDRSGRVDFRKFYLGRARRLLPALILVLVVVSLAAALVYQDAARQLASDVVASIFYVNNWWYIAADQSYFEFIGRPPLLKHLWSLAVEEQFYLVWPAIAFLAMRRFARKGVFAVAATLAILSTIWMLQLAVANGFPDFADPSRAYFGTDSHSMGLLIGAAMATFWRPGRMRRSLPTGASVIITAIGIAALLAVIWFFVFVGEFTPWLYRGGFLGLALIVATLIAAASHPGVGLGKAMGTQPWRYIGQRSYGLYLWHWPVFMATRPGLDLSLDGVPPAHPPTRSHRRHRGAQLQVRRDADSPRGDSAVRSTDQGRLGREAQAPAPRGDRDDQRDGRECRRSGPPSRSHHSHGRRDGRRSRRRGGDGHHVRRPDRGVLGRWVRGSDC
jgi:peptidoglycan/LPS O-acetylase OafA/YrhL